MEMSAISQELPARGEAMDHAGEAPFAISRPQDLGGVGFGIAGVHDQRQLRLAAGGDVRRKSSPAGDRGRYGRNNNRVWSRRCRPRGAAPSTSLAASISGARPPRAVNADRGPYRSARPRRSLRPIRARESMLSTRLRRRPHRRAPAPGLLLAQALVDQGGKWLS